jgi:hypothetical protein
MEANESSGNLKSAVGQRILVLASRLEHSDLFGSFYVRVSIAQNYYYYYYILFLLLLLLFFQVIGHALFAPPAGLRPSVTAGTLSRIVRCLFFSIQNVTQPPAFV